jgi:phosphotransacetylase
MEKTMNLPPVHTFDQIRRNVIERTMRKKPRAALVVPHEAASLPAFADAAALGLIDPIVIGDEALFSRAADELGIDLDRVKMIDVNQLDMAVKIASRMAEADELDFIVQGRLTPDLFVQLLASQETAFVLPGRLLSHVGVLKPARYPKLLFVTDGLVHEEPALATKVQLLDNLARVARAVGVDQPRTAVVTAVEAIYPQMPATTDAAVLAKMYERGQLKGVRVDGPLSFDIAVDFFAAESKGIRDSVVAGQADAILGSTKYVAQGVYQAMTLFAEGESGGLLVGGRVPVALNFVSEPVTARLNSIMLACLLS